MKDPDMDDHFVEPDTAMQNLNEINEKRSINKSAPTLQDQFAETKRKDDIDAKMGFERYNQGPCRLGWLINMQPVLEIDNRRS